MQFIILPLEVLGLGIIISYAMALLIKLMLVGIRYFSKEETKQSS